MCNPIPPPVLLCVPSAVIIDMLDGAAGPGLAEAARLDAGTATRWAGYAIWGIDTQRSRVPEVSGGLVVPF
jgi:hypothetical protein